jgi:hypothetical protein
MAIHTASLEHSPLDLAIVLGQRRLRSTRTHQALNNGMFKVQKNPKALTSLSSAAKLPHESVSSAIA